jgi:hypothetical protein
VIILDQEGDAAIARALGAACLATGTPLLTAGSREAAGDDFLVAGTAAGTTDAETAAASRLWGRGTGREGRPGDPAPIDLGRVVRERSAALLPAGSTELAARACAELAALAGDLRRIGVDGDALVWVPHGERVPAQALRQLLSDGPDAGVCVLIGTTSPAAAAELAAQAGTALIHRVADPDLAIGLAARTGTCLLPRPATDPRSQGAVPAAPAVDLVPSPVIPARTLLTLGRGEFVLAATWPRQRLIAPGLMVPARLPRAAGGQAAWEEAEG